MKKLKNVLLLATDHNITKAYIYRLHRLGLRPSTVVLLNWRNNNYSTRIEGLRPHDFSITISTINSRLKSNSLFSGNLTESTEQTLKTVGWEYKTLTIDHINDEGLTNFIENANERYIIYCGGGILRKRILNCGKRFIHVHPGVVPEMRGADCLLWSALVNNQIGLSAFFMNEGIDTGDIIKTATFEIPKFDINVSQINLEAVKKILINYVDPHYRAEMLATLFDSNSDPSQWKTRKQYFSDGKTYYFMHKALLPQAISKFCQTETKIVD